jgi:hypothetical protein
LQYPFESWPEAQNTWVPDAVREPSKFRTMTRGPDLADWLRWTGLVCELTGLAITAAGIGDLRRRYSDRPGVVGVVGAALRRRWSRIQTAATTAREAGGRAWQWLRRAGRYRWNQALNVTRRLRGRPEVHHGQAIVALAGVAEAVAEAHGTLTVTRAPWSSGSTASNSGLRRPSALSSVSKAAWTIASVTSRAVGFAPRPSVSRSSRWG